MNEQFLNNTWNFKGERRFKRNETTKKGGRNYWGEKKYTSWFITESKTDK